MRGRVGVFWRWGFLGLGGLTGLGFGVWWLNRLRAEAVSSVALEIGRLN